ncbi:BRCT domain-containing protein [Halomonas sp. I1]|uniref:BRCT domain-containing protein n=1 Tax=Halomonas sp. I1 TaxID=393536 RepID=UPI0028DFA2EB|nr:BRCT domain-containing protein [Halomonas sp. I1]MDT8895484.1 BRCT domain-containing protein [Halomonas sp. I1]
MNNAGLDENAQPVTRRMNLARNTTRDANELTGIARGVLADGALNQTEAEFLLKWFDERPESLAVWPFNVIFQRLSDALEDGQLDAEEERDLIELLLDFTGGGSTDGAVASRASTLPLNSPEPEIEFEGAHFCLTGAFATGSRKECEREIADRGGMPKPSVTKKTSYLVIGNVGSTDWANTTYGRKIEKAVMLRDDGGQIAIVSERHWAEALG